MTRSHHEQRRKLAHHDPSRAMPDGAVYGSLLLIGAFAVTLGALAFDVHWTHLAVGYVIALAVLVNLYAWRAYLGHPLAPWQQALARVPLRFANIGGRHGRPFVAAKHDDSVRLVLMLCLAASSLLIVLATFVMIR